MGAMLVGIGACGAPGRSTFFSAARSGVSELRRLGRYAVTLMARVPAADRRGSADFACYRGAYGAGLLLYHQSCRLAISARRSIRNSSTVGRPTYHQPL